MKLQPVTLDAIAAAAGVHKMTVSRALRNHPAVAPATREKIQRIARELGYRPNPLLTVFQAHVRSRHAPEYVATLAWLIASVEPSYWERPWTEGLLKGAQARAADLGFKLDQIYLGNLKHLPIEERIRRYTKVLHTRGIHGLIIPHAESPRFASREWENMAVVAIGQHHIDVGDGKEPVESLESRYHTVAVDYYGNLRIAFEALKAREYKRIGLLLSPWLDNITDHQYRAAYLYLQSFLPARDRLPILIDGNMKDDPSPTFCAWIKKERPDALLCATNKALPWLEAVGMAVPDRIGVAHLWLAADVADWSGVDPRMPQIGSTAVDILVHQLQHNELHPPEVARQTVITGGWRQGLTTRHMSGNGNKGHSEAD